MGRGIFDLIGLLGVLIFALPVALFGLQRLVAGEPLMGVVTIGIAVGMVAVEEYLTSPRDIPTEVASAAVGKAVETPDDDE
ncbi:MAG: hypothetical protein V5A43_09670 [Haloarculaceae archaeon]